MAKLFVPVQLPEPEKADTLDLKSVHPARAFGRVPFYLLVDSKTREVKLVPNTNHHFGGNDSPAMIAKKSGAEVVLAAHMGSRPYSMFEEYNLPIYKVDTEATVEQLVEAFENGKLTLIDPPAPGTCCSGHKH